MTECKHEMIKFVEMESGSLSSSKFRGRYECLDCHESVVLDTDIYIHLDSWLSGDYWRLKDRGKQDG